MESAGAPAPPRAVARSAASPASGLCDLANGRESLEVPAVTDADGLDDRAPGPIVLLDVPGGTYWSGFLEFVRAELDARGYISPHDLSMVHVTDNVDAMLRAKFANDAAKFIESRPVAWIVRRRRRMLEEVSIVDEVAVGTR